MGTKGSVPNRIRTIRPGPQRWQLAATPGSTTAAIQQFSLTRNVNPVIVQEVVKQLRPEGANAFTPLMPSMFYHLFIFFVCVL